MNAAIEDSAPVAKVAPPIRLPLWQVVAVGAGNALEFYDFLTFSFFAIQIGRSFFPASATSHGLLFSLATFGAGFLTRPLGGLVIGAYSDRAGRKPAMMLSFTLMGAAIVGLALTPSYAQIGMAAPLLLLAFRLVQGFALGGQVGPSTAFLIEAAPPLRRGLYVGLQYGTQDFSVLVAGVVGFTLSNLLAPAALDAWGWRLAFLLGATIVPLGLILRRRLPETLEGSGRHAARGGRSRSPVRVLVLGLFMLANTGISNYVLEYMTTYAQDSLHMAVNTAFGLTIVLGLFMMVSEVLGGMLTDRVGRKPVMLTAAGLMLLLVIPAYVVMTRSPNVLAIFGVMAVLAVLNGFFSTPALVAITEGLPKAVRSGALGTLYAVAMATFGGSTQAVVRWLIDVTGSPLGPHGTWPGLRRWGSWRWY
ncbi:MAG: transporter [Caulobacteraceae bacterium]|nr:transporter [Caulobacteraceae bacterium]